MYVIASLCPTIETLPGWHIAARATGVVTDNMTTLKTREDILVSAELCPPDSPRRIPVPPRPLGKQFNQKNSGNEAAHMRPNRYATVVLASFRDGGRSAHQELHHKPIAEKQPSRQVDKKYRRDPGHNPSPGI